MNAEELRLLASFAVVAGFFLPMFSGASQKYRYRKIVRCPEAEKSAEVGIVASRTGLFSPAGIKVRACSLWPQRKGCAQKCLERR
jgi:hypothetical protein